MVQIIFFFWSFEISGDILRNQKITLGLGTFSNQNLIHWLRLDDTSLCIDYPFESCTITVIAMLSNIKS